MALYSSLVRWLSTAKLRLERSGGDRMQLPLALRLKNPHRDDINRMKVNKVIIRDNEICCWCGWLPVCVRASVSTEHWRCLCVSEPLWPITWSQQCFTTQFQIKPLTRHVICKLYIKTPLNYRCTRFKEGSAGMMVLRWFELLVSYKNLVKSFSWYSP